MSFYLDLDAILSSKPPAADAAEDEFVGEEKRRGVPEGAVGVTAATGAAAGAGGDGEEDGLFARRPVFRSLAVAPAMHPGAASAVRLPADHAPASEAEFVPSSVSSVAAPAAARSGASLPPCLPICGLQRTHVALLAGVSPLSVMSHVTAALQKAPYSVDGQLDGFKSCVTAVIDAQFVKFDASLFMDRPDTSRPARLVLEFNRRRGNSSAFRRVWRDVCAALAAVKLIDAAPAVAARKAAAPMLPLPVPASLLSAVAAPAASAPVPVPVPVPSAGADADVDADAEAEAKPATSPFQFFTDMLQSGRVGAQREAAVALAHAAAANPVMVAAAGALDVLCSVAASPTSADPALLAAVTSAISTTLCDARCSTVPCAEAAANALATVLATGNPTPQTMHARREAAHALATMATNPAHQAAVAKAFNRAGVAASVRAACFHTHDAALQADAEVALGLVQ